MIESSKGCLQAVCNQCEFVSDEREQSAPLIGHESEQRNAMFASRGDHVCKLLQLWHQDRDPPYAPRPSRTASEDSLAPDRVGLLRGGGGRGAESPRRRQRVDGTRYDGRKVKILDIDFQQAYGLGSVKVK